MAERILGIEDKRVGLSEHSDLEKEKHRDLMPVAPIVPIHGFRIGFYTYDGFMGSEMKICSPGLLYWLTRIGVGVQSFSASSFVAENYYKRYLL